MKDETVLKEMRFKNGRLDLELEGGACQALAEAFITQFKDSGATNYLEVGLYNEEIGPITVTIQRVHGLTPGEQLAKAKALLKAANCPECGDKSGVYSDNYGLVCQCQWCDEVESLTPSTNLQE
jgi:hypothetical protein